MRQRARRRLTVFAAVITVTLAGCTAAQARAAERPSPPAASAPAPPNIVFILTDDLSWNLVQYMPHVLEMRKAGLTFTDYTVTDSLCCPSRSSIFSGMFPHDTGVFTNDPPDGGFGVFHDKGDEKDTFATALSARGYRTALMGKYLNGYLATDKEGGLLPYVPPGWSEWDVGGYAYGEFNYNLNENHKVVDYGSQPADYLTDVLAAKGSLFIRGAAAAHSPFMLEIATYAPHSPEVPAPRDAHAFPGLRAPRTPAFDRLPTDPPVWLAGAAPLSPSVQHQIDTRFRKRAQAVQAVDRLIGQVEDTLTATGLNRDTYLVFSSDNGYHLGEYRMNWGKQTAFDTDVLVPLVVVGPGVPAGATRSQTVQNIDLAPTFEQLTGTKVGAGVEGRSLVPLLGRKQPLDWRTAALIEHHGPDGVAPGDPDAQTVINGLPSTYEAMRTDAYTYVEYANGQREYYDRVRDPYELRNIAGRLSAKRLAALHAALLRLESCHTAAACWTAGHVAT